MRNVRVVTITGADESIEPRDLIPLTREFPFVEWGILLSKKREGTRRFPAPDWTAVLAGHRDAHPELRLSGHLCGRWVRDLLAGNPSFAADRPSIADIFGRFQLNFHAEPHEIQAKEFAGVSWVRKHEFILQMDGVNEVLLTEARALGIRCNPLFDTSGGEGILPEEWPAYIEPYCGYAGGLSPDNLDDQMALIQSASQGKPIWIDVETKVRSDNDRQFDLDLVRRFLETASKYVAEGPRE